MPLPASGGPSVGTAGAVLLPAAALLLGSGVLVYVLWHFYSSMSGSALTSFEMLVERILRGERLCRDAIVEMMQRRHPWRRDSLLDDWMAIGLARSGRLDPGYKYWFQGHRIRACHFWTVHALSRGSARIRCFFQPYAVASKPHG